MTKIGLVIRPGVEEACVYGHKLLEWAKARGHEVLIEELTRKALGLAGADLSCVQLIAEADPIVTLGGDGTLIGVARYVGPRVPLMLGVNFGRLGFLTEISPAELFSVLEDVLAGRARHGERRILSVEVRREGRSVFSSQAVNDVVIQKGVREKLLEMDFSVNDENVMRIRGDGIIIATPTGSTAYSLAAGGSIVYPSLEVVLITPICPHALTNRPFILPVDRVFSVRFPPFDGKIFLMVDGQVSTPLQVADEVVVTRSVHAVRFVRSPTRSYFEILRKKLNWGVANES